MGFRDKIAFHQTAENSPRSEKRVDDHNPASPAAATAVQLTRSRRVKIAVVAVALLLCAASVFFYHSLKQQVAKDAKNNLETIARFKAIHIQTGLEEARSDVRLTLHTKSFVSELEAWLRGGRRDPNRGDRLRGRLQELIGTGNLRDITLYDAEGSLVMRTADGGPAPHQKIVLAAIEASSSPPNDFRIDDSFDIRGFAFFSSLRVSDAAPPIAILHVALHAERILLPLLEQWPTLSPSAEVLLVRRDAGVVESLNPPRHREPPVSGPKLHTDPEPE